VFALRRLLASLGTVVAASILVFAMARLIPGDPASIMLGSQGISNPDIVEQYRREYSLDQPLPAQYATWAWKALHGDFGRSIAERGPVLPLIVERLGHTAVLALSAALLASVLGVLVGTAGALSAPARPAVDRILTLLSVAGIAAPQFGVGLFLVVVLAVQYPLFPVLGMHTPGREDVPDLVWHLVLPTVTLAIHPAAVVARLVRTNVLEVLSQPYVRTAHAKGLPERLVFYDHALRNALLPIVTTLGLMTGSFLGGAVLIETIFAWPGLGYLMLNALGARDYPVIQGITLIVSVTYVSANLIVDASYGLLDPRVRLAGRHGG
jgi:peptide/nickel transport system permease protein